MNDQRVKFEAWVSGRTVVKKYGAKLTTRADGSYADYRINDRWLAWQAALSAHKPVEGELTLLQQYEDACIAANANAKDAERYRWLRDQTETDGIAIVMKNKHIDDSQSYADNIDRFIDAAITQQGKEGA